MKKHQNKEKLLLSRILAEVARVIDRRDRGIGNRQMEKRTLEIVEERLERWVAEGKHRLKYDSMDGILEDLGLTSEELSKYCTARLKKNFLSWRKDLRMEEAKKLLLESPDKPACKIGKDLGITDKSNFRHQFKSVTGLTPSQWRKKFQKI